MAGREGKSIETKPSASFPSRTSGLVFPPHEDIMLRSRNERTIAWRRWDGNPRCLPIGARMALMIAWVPHTTMIYYASYGNPLLANCLLISMVADACVFDCLSFRIQRYFLVTAAVLVHMWHGCHSHVCVLNQVPTSRIAQLVYDAL